MKQLNLIFFLILISHLCLSSQIQFKENIISEQLFVYPFVIRPFDIDQDNDLDIIIPSINGNKISWFENLGNGSFGNQQIITDNLNHPVPLEICDLDCDGVMDLVTSLSSDEKYYG